MTRDQPSAMEVRVLRDRTSCGLTDCRAALIACKCYMDLAEEWLWVKGQAVACPPGQHPRERVEAEAARRAQEEPTK